MKQIASLRMTQAVARYSDHAPLATACCNACRTCVTTNIVSLATAALTGSGLAVARLGKRLVGRS